MPYMVMGNSGGLFDRPDVKLIDQVIEAENADDAWAQFLAAMPGYQFLTSPCRRRFIVKNEYQGTIEDLLNLADTNIDDIGYEVTLGRIPQTAIDRINSLRR